ncbi:hypothetical protein GA0070624_0155 [Micromonospora rhizosphaerae]|uniref:Uncharacterized protein n=1 Tax=Micromonospora rhizosphaerae TaxID=568872 RepID=A0A1C6R8V3_9ACTN|nr:hypothetical protein [Micromonospora rhizosphaerae]SCL13513.1 hypothetical protein GA0070624_0155 [Micromonospora rhizosphaerae]
MIKLFRHRRTAHVQGVTLCEPCGQVCTAACRADARYDRTRTTALANHIR